MPRIHSLPGQASYSIGCLSLAIFTNWLFFQMAIDFSQLVGFLEQRSLLYFIYNASFQKNIILGQCSIEYIKILDLFFIKIVYTFLSS